MLKALRRFIPFLLIPFRGSSYQNRMQRSKRRSGGRAWDGRKSQEGFRQADGGSLSPVAHWSCSSLPPCWVIGGGSLAKQGLSDSPGGRILSTNQNSQEQAHHGRPLSKSVASLSDISKTYCREDTVFYVQRLLS